jgi:hypothetical protein
MDFAGNAGKNSNSRVVFDKNNCMIYNALNKAVER